MRIAGMLALAVAVIGGCGDGTGPEERPEGSLEFLRFPAQPPVQAMEVAFWAVRGEDRRTEIRYLPRAPGEEGEEFLEFRVPGNSLLRRPDGSLFANRDSIRITIKLSGDGRFLFEMEPSGLQFDPGEPARLRIRYDRVGGDLNGDGRSDDSDSRLEERLRVWRQERAGEPWIPVGTVRVRELKEVEGRINGFTGFAIAG